MTTTEAGTTDSGAEPQAASALDAFAEKMFVAALGAMEVTIVGMGRALGLYGALRTGPLTYGGLAAATGVDARYAREWVEQQAASGVLTADGAADAAARRYTLPADHATALLDEENPAYVGALADVPAFISRTLEALTGAFRTGAGVPFADYGLHDLQAGFTRPMFANSLVAEWLPALADVHGRLVAGEAVRIADFGCGEGWACIYLAEAFPAAVVHGFDLDEASIAAARKHAADRGVGERVRFELRDVTDPAFTGRFDLVLACEVIHDLADPVGALRAMRRLAGDTGTVLVIDENTTETFESPADEIQRLLYAFSVLHCLPVGRVAANSAETGTVMRPDTFRSYAAAAGFADVEVLPVENLFFRFYRPRG